MPFKKGQISWNKGKECSEETKMKMRLNHKGTIGYHFSEEYRKKLSLANLGRKHTEESKIKMSLVHKGKNPWINFPNPKGMLGKKHSEETKRKMSETQKRIGIKPPSALGRKYPEEYKRKLSSIFMGHSVSEETKEKIRQARKNQRYSLKDTSIEIKLQNFLKEQKIEFETHYPILGQPDIFIKPNICIFADGCYWHKCPECGFGELRQRDKQITQELQKQGYTVIRIWEHEINNSQFSGLNQILN